MTRTTIGLDDELLARLKEMAAREGRTMQAVVNDLLRQGLKGVEASRQGEYRLDLEGWDATMRPGVDLLDRDVLFDLMDRE